MNISRQEFLQQTAMAGVALLLSSIGFAKSVQQQKIKVGVIGCGSVSTQYLPHLSKSPFVELISTIRNQRKENKIGIGF